MKDSIPYSLYELATSDELNDSEVNHHKRVLCVILEWQIDTYWLSIYLSCSVDPKCICLEDLVELGIAALPEIARYSTL